MLIRVCNRPLQERHRTGLSREQMSLWLAGYPKTPRLRHPIWVISGHWSASIRCPLYPQKRTSLNSGRMSALCQKRTLSRLFNHLVGGDAQTLWHVEAKRPRGLEVDHEIKLGRQLYGQIGRLFAPQNAVHIEGG